MEFVFVIYESGNMNFWLKARPKCFTI